MLLAALIPTILLAQTTVRPEQIKYPYIRVAQSPGQKGTKVRIDQIRKKTPNGCIIKVFLQPQLFKINSGLTVVHFPPTIQTKCP